MKFREEVEEAIKDIVEEYIKEKLYVKLETHYEREIETRTLKVSVKLKENGYVSYNDPVVHEEIYEVDDMYYLLADYKKDW